MAYDTVKVNADGSAPKGLKTGTVVRTAGGDFKITNVKSDGSYESAKVYNDQSGVGSSKANPTSNERKVSTQVMPNQSQEYMDRLKQAQINNAVSTLKAKRNEALSNLDTEQANVRPQFQAQRQSVNAQSQQGKLNMAEYMANRGLTSSGSSAQAEMNRQATLNSNLGTLRNEEAKRMADIERMRTNVNNTYETDLASAKNGIEAQAMQNAINQYNQDRNFNLSEAGVTGMYNGQQTMQGKLNSLNTKQMELTLSYLPQQLQDEAKLRANNLAIQGLQLEYLPQQYQDEAKARALDLAIKSITLKYTPQQMEAELSNIRNQIWARTQTTNADVANTYNSISNRNAGTQLDREKFEWDKTHPSSGGGAGSDGKFTAEDYRKTAEGMLKGDLVKTNADGTNSGYTFEDVKTYLYGTDLTDQEIATILNSLPR